MPCIGCLMFILPSRVTWNSLGVPGQSCRLVSRGPAKGPLSGKSPSYTIHCPRSKNVTKCKTTYSWVPKREQEKRLLQAGLVWSMLVFYAHKSQIPSIVAAVQCYSPHPSLPLSSSFFFLYFSPSSSSSFSTTKVYTARECQEDLADHSFISQTCIKLSTEHRLGGKR